MVGVCLLMLTLASEFTGYLLPWNQVSYWATTVGTETAAVVPVIGEHLLLLLRGGKQISAVTLTRFYAFHVFVWPAAIVLLLVGHFFMMRRQGFTEPYSEDDRDARHERNPREGNAS
jgi:quinol-cytochrome oxidoreductase complex cytochrome b subunit